MGIFNPDGYVLEGWQHKLEEAKGVKEKLDPDIKEVMAMISRGDVSRLVCFYVKY